MNRTNAINQGVSQYRKGIKAIDGSTNVLKRSIANGKLGKLREWRAGSFKGMPLYSLTLEERATCDNGCQAWSLCYGNNMPFAHRFDVTQDGGLALMARLTFELDKLDTMHPQGYSVRLHILGDFFSVEYVDFWINEIRNRPLLNVYGYTHRQGAIKAAIDAGFAEHRARFNVFQSDGESALESRPVALLESTTGAQALPICPEQTGKAKGCLDCGLCTLPNVKGVQFLEH